MLRPSAAILLGGLLLLGGRPVDALDLSRARVTPAADLSAHEKKAVDLLVGEVERRTGLTWPLGKAEADAPAIVVRHASGTGPAEGFRVRVADGGVELQGNDERGTLFAVGRLLRELRWERGKVEVPDGFAVTTSPKYPLRGHQIGYRPKVNTYDAWTPAVFEQYVRDMAVFGANAVELIPPRSDDDDDSPHFHLAKLPMMAEMSRIIASYGLQVWIWYPAMDRDYADAKTVDFALREWGEVLGRLPHVDAILVPGGDPGHTPPKPLMSFLAREADVLHQHHPKAQVWVSAQGFSPQWLDDFLTILKSEPEWLDGITFGPWTRISLAELRSKVPARYPIRNYPDITHSIHCEYAVPNWDPAFAVTEARESINPRPLDSRKEFEVSSPASVGFITYSEGVNDDVNKFVWSGLGWDPNQDVAQTLREYSRYFLNPKYDDAFAQGILALEQNWRGPLLSNAGVENTRRQFQAIDAAATPDMLRNWRYQQLMYRALYDSFIRRRLIHETALEQEAIERLNDAGRLGSRLAIDDVLTTLNRAIREPVATELRSRIFALAEALYQSIGMQLSVDRYQAIAVSRGANLDTVDFPLNNRVWLEAQLNEARTRPNESDRLAAIEAIVNRTNPGPGGFYDDLGNTQLQPHLVLDGPNFDQDPGAFRSSRTAYLSFNGGLIGRTSRDATRTDHRWSFLQRPSAVWTYQEARYDNPLVMRYEHLDPKAHYTLRVVYVNNLRVRLVANEGTEIVGPTDRPASFQSVEYALPAETTATGTLNLRWSSPAGNGVAIAEVFLIRK